MKDNAFGVLMKLAIAGWTLVCGWYFASGCLGSAQRLEGDNMALGVAVMVSAALWGALWFFPTIGGYLLYRVFGRSGSAEKKERAKRITRDNAAGKWQCPWCFGELDPRAEVCPHCRRPTVPVT